LTLAVVRSPTLTFYEKFAAYVYNAYRIFSLKNQNDIPDIYGNIDAARPGLRGDAPVVNQLGPGERAHYRRLTLRTRTSSTAAATAGSTGSFEDSTREPARNATARRRRRRAG
jgi:hypothetical protein